MIAAPALVTEDRQIGLAAAELARRLPDAVVKTHEPMARHTTFRIGGPADIFLHPRRSECLLEALRAAREMGLPWRVVGNGSNLLVGDRGIRGLVFRLAPDFSEVEWLADGVRVGGGARLGKLIRDSSEAGLSGLESMVGIPGTVGGAIAMNAGTDTGCIGDLVVGATVLENGGDLRQWDAAQFSHRYRHSAVGLAKAIVIAAHLRLAPAPPEEIRAKIERLRMKRASRQPLTAWSAGSAFKNPLGTAAGKILDRAGAKNMRIGDAQVSAKHANFLLNRGRATADDMKALIARAHALALRRYGIDLELEIELVGE